VYMLQRSSTRKSQVSKAIGKRGRPGKQRVSQACNIYEGVDEGCWWLGRVQKIRRKIGSRWGISRTPIDLQNRPVTSKSPSGPAIQVRLNWFSKALGNMKFKYDHSDCKWIDLDTIISTVTLTYNAVQKVYILDPSDFASLNDFAKSRT
jgi:hypothetical protein